MDDGQHRARHTDTHWPHLEKQVPWFLPLLPEAEDKAISCRKGPWSMYNNQCRQVYAHIPVPGHTGSRLLKQLSQLSPLMVFGCNMGQSWETQTRAFQVKLNWKVHPRCTKGSPAPSGHSAYGTSPK